MRFYPADPGNIADRYHRGHWQKRPPGLQRRVMPDFLKIQAKYKNQAETAKGHGRGGNLRAAEQTDPK